MDAGLASSALSMLCKFSILPGYFLWNQEKGRRRGGADKIPALKEQIRPNSIQITQNRRDSHTGQMHLKYKYLYFVT